VAFNPVEIRIGPVRENFSVSEEEGGWEGMRRVGKGGGRAYLPSAMISLAFRLSVAASYASCSEIVGSLAWGDLFCSVEEEGVEKSDITSLSSPLAVVFVVVVVAPFRLVS